MTAALTSRPLRTVPTAAAFTPETGAGILLALPHPVFVFQRTDCDQPIFANDAARSLGLSNDVFAPSMMIGAALRQVSETASPLVMHDVDLGGNIQSAISITVEADYLIVTVAPLTRVIDHGRAAREALRPAALMARTLAHEIKNPLAGISAAAQLLIRQMAHETAAELPALILKESQRIGRLLENVMQFDDTVSAQMTPLNVHAPLEQALASFALASDIQITRDFDPSLPDILGGNDQLVQVFLNLCRNAAEAGASRIMLRTYYELAQPAVDTATQTKLPIVVRLEDDGTGMSAETCDRLFEPYYTTKPQGQGLGLAIVAKIIQDLQGQITVESVPGKTAFTLYFPHYHHAPEVS